MRAVHRTGPFHLCPTGKTHLCKRVICLFCLPKTIFSRNTSYPRAKHLRLDDIVLCQTFTVTNRKTFAMQSKRHTTASQTLTSLLAALFIFLFTYTGLTKLLHEEQFNSVLLSSPFLSPYAVVIRWAVPLCELAVVGLFSVPHLRSWGFLGAAALLAVFSLYIGALLVTRQHLPCSCGALLSSLSWPQHLALNGLLTVLAVTGFCLAFTNKLFIAINRDCPKPEEKSRQFLSFKQ